MIEQLTPLVQHPIWAAFLGGGVAVLAAATLLWLLGLKLRDVSIVDVFWGLGFVGAAWIYRAFGPPAEPRQWLVLALVTVWGVRLSGYLLWRNWGTEEDYRYREMRAKDGDAFWWKSYFKVFLLQGLLISVIATPLLLVEASENPPGWRWSDGVGLALWLVGFFFEAVGDLQLARFKADPENRGKVLRSGLWGWTRHPNYFGDATLWWGYFFFALAVPGGVWTLPSVLLMNLFLLKVSGVALLEKTIAERRPEYRDYVESTPAFFPRPPRRPRGGGGGGS